MRELENVTDAVDTALERVRGELATLERVFAVLKGSIDESGVPVGGENMNRESTTGDAVETAGDWPSLHGVGRVLSKELWLPEYGAIQPPDDRA